MLRRIGWLGLVVIGVIVPAIALGEESTAPAGPPPAGPPPAEQGAAPATEGAAAGSGEAGAAPTVEGQVDPEAAAFLSGTERPEIEAPEQERGVGWDEPPDMRFWMVGVRHRTIFVPGWLLNAFLDFPESPGDDLAGPFFANQAVGLEFTTRKNNLSIVGSIWWAGYWSAEAGRSYEAREFLASEEDKTEDPEFIRSSLSLLLFSADFIFSTMFFDWFGITYGAGLGLGITLGEVTRTEAYPSGDGGHEHCVDAGNPRADYCEPRGGEDDGYYDTRESRVWPVFPWVNFLLGLRFKPFRHMEINVDGGVGLGFLLGMRANYIF